jgi:hypothetical protein
MMLTVPVSDPAALKGAQRPAADVDVRRTKTHAPMAARADRSIGGGGWRRMAEP